MYRLNEEKMFYDIADGVAIVIDFTTGMYYGMSTLGSAILDRLLKGVSTGCILTALKKAPDCPMDMEERLNTFIGELTVKDMLISGETNDDEAVPFDAQTFSDGFDLTLDEFAEVQDLIMADPIHEVDVEQGWPKLKKE